MVVDVVDLFVLYLILIFCCLFVVLAVSFYWRYGSRAKRALAKARARLPPLPRCLARLFNPNSGLDCNVSTKLLTEFEVFDEDGGEGGGGGASGNGNRSFFGAFDSDEDDDDDDDGPVDSDDREDDDEDDDEEDDSDFELDAVRAHLGYQPGANVMLVTTNV